MRFLLLLPLLAACAPPPSPDAGCAFYAEKRGDYTDDDYLNSPEGMQLYVLSLDEGMRETCGQGQRPLRR